MVKLRSDKLGGRGGAILRNFGTFWLAYKEGTILAGRKQKDTGDLTKWIMKKYPDLRIQLLQFLSEEILDSEDRDHRWRLIGDETFHHGLLRYVWVVVPPKVNLKTTRIDYHAIDDPEQNEGLTEELLLELVDNADSSLPIDKRVQVHVFDGGKKKSEEVEYTIGKLPDTIPLMLESIRCSCKKSSEEHLKIQILPEGFSSGISQAGRPISSLITAYVNSSKVDIEPRFASEPVGNDRFLQKGEHPYMAYPDAVGFALHPLQKENLGELRARLEAITTNWTFEQAERISKGILSSENLGDANKFYMQLRGLDSDLCLNNKKLKAIIENHSRNLISSLSVSNFIDFEKNSRSTPNYQFASDIMIQGKGGIDSWIAELDGRAFDKLFELNLSGLAYANRRSDGDLIRSHIHENIRIHSHRDSNIKDERYESFQRLAEAASHRIFDFRMREFGSLDEVVRRAFGSDTNLSIRSYLRLRLIKEAYRDGPKVRPKIFEIQNKLLEDFEDARDFVYCLEMLTDLSRGSGNSHYLEKAVSLLDYYSGRINSSESNPWDIAAKIKLGAELGRNKLPIPSSISDLIPEISKDFSTDSFANNPIVRQLSWGARICDSLDFIDQRDMLTDILSYRARSSVEGIHEPFKDSLGITHACHLIDLEQNGWGSSPDDLIGQGYLNLVIDSSSDTTKVWVSENLIIGDPLSPLNLMHR